MPSTNPRTLILSIPLGFPNLDPGVAEDPRAQPGDSLRYTVALEGAEQIGDLLTMTPHLYRASAEGRAKAAALTALSLTVDVRLTRFARKPGK